MHPSARTGADSNTASALERTGAHARTDTARGCDVRGLQSALALVPDQARLLGLVLNRLGLERLALFRRPGACTGEPTARTCAERCLAKPRSLDLSSASARTLKAKALLCSSPRSRVQCEHQDAPNPKRSSAPCAPRRSAVAPGRSAVAPESEREETGREMTETERERNRREQREHERDV